jgi:hypothetical protein
MYRFVAVLMLTSMLGSQVTGFACGFTHHDQSDTAISTGNAHSPQHGAGHSDQTTESRQRSSDSSQQNDCVFMTGCTAMTPPSMVENTSSAHELLESTLTLIDQSHSSLRPSTPTPPPKHT